LKILLRYTIKNFFSCTKIACGKYLFTDRNIVYFTSHQKNYLIIIDLIIHRNELLIYKTKKTSDFFPEKLLIVIPKLAICRMKNLAIWGDYSGKN